MRAHFDEPRGLRGLERAADYIARQSGAEVIAALPAARAAAAA